uniref:TIR domain-containing protein n=1 Tax=Knipowitschia caucasica TaxID=637954 RepID=A0AAV2JYH4_KNICA
MPRRRRSGGTFCVLEEDGWRVKGISTLHIQHVHRGLLNRRIVCRVQTPVGDDQGCVWLTQAEVGPLQRALEWFLGPCLLLLLLSVCVYCCRLELLLLYRDLRTRFRTGHQVPCEKLYDAVVTCVIQSPSGLAPSELSHFSQQLLPRHLEDHWGYRLYIQGRDDCPGEALHDALSAVVQSSRRLLLLLCGSDSLGAPPLSQELQPLCYEQSVGLYDALTHREPRVVLIEISAEDGLGG